MTERFNRIRRVQVGNIDISHLDCEFKIKRTLRRQPNTAELTVYNLSGEASARIRDTRDLFVDIAAGYEHDGDPPLLFRGIATNDVTVYKQNTEIVLEIKARDGAPSLKARINRSYEPNVNIKQVLNDLVQSLGVGKGNLDNFINDSLLSTRQNTLPQGFVSAGNAWIVFDRIIRASGNRWSIQNGVIQIIKQDNTRIRVGKLIKSETGLIGSPKRDKQGKVTIEVLLQSGLEPGNVIRLVSDFVEGDYEIQETTYTGSTFGANPSWSATCVLKPIAAQR
jgi:hypothetical protein